MFTVLLRSIVLALCMVAAHAPQNRAVRHLPEPGDLTLRIDSGSSDHAVISTRTLASASVLRQSSRERAALTNPAIADPMAARALACGSRSRDVRVALHLPYCITPRPPPLPRSI